MLEVWQSLIPGMPRRIYEDNQACIAIEKKGYSAKLRHLAKAHRVNVESTCEVVNANESVVCQYCRTDDQRGDPLTKAHPIQMWEHALVLLGISQQPLPDLIE